MPDKENPSKNTHTNVQMFRFYVVVLLLFSLYDIYISVSKCLSEFQGVDLCCGITMIQHVSVQH